MAICIIPARGGSKRIPRKNIRLFHGLPIISYSIATALESKLFEAVYVSTEDEEIANVSRANGALVVNRPPCLAEIGVPDCGTQEVVRHALMELGIHWGTVCCLYATAPMVTANDLRLGEALLGINDYAVAVHASRIEDAGQWYWGRASAFIDRLPLSSPKTVIVPIEEARVCDINTEEDWMTAVRMYEAWIAS